MPPDESPGVFIKMLRHIRSTNDFPPFEKFSIHFPSVESGEELGEVHLFTGINGTGKTRILSLISAMLGNPVHLSNRLKGYNGNCEFRVSDNDGEGAKVNQWPDRFYAASGGGGWSHLSTTGQWLQSVPAFSYSGGVYIEDADLSPMAVVKKPSRTECLSFGRPTAQSKTLLQAVMNLKIKAAIDSMNKSSEGRAALIMNSLEETITKITGRDFSFTVSVINTNALFVRWGGVELAFNLLPDGLRSIIGWLAHAVVMLDIWIEGKGDLKKTEVIFILDEIESHLHPAWQRKILPAFQLLFPKSQIFAATHSPFLISSVNHGWVHKLKIDNSHKVVFDKPISASLGDSYVSVVEDIMGMNEWFDQETECLLSKFRTMKAEAYKRTEGYYEKTLEYASLISKRSPELDLIMKQELIQLKNQLKVDA